jgi:hypothetical protein
MLTGKPKEWRCPFCPRRPLLAMYGVDVDGRLYVHVKIERSGRTTTESVFKGGSVSIKCRDCYRWQDIVISGGRAVMEEIDPPHELEIGAPSAASGR